MVTTAFIKIWGETVGAVAWDMQNQLASFEYEPRFIDKGWELAPIKMPLSTSNRIFSFPELRTKDPHYDTFKGLPGLLADVLPDKYGNQLINTWLAQNGRSPGSMNPVEQLCFIGKRGVGALEFEPSKFKASKNTFKVEVDNLVEIAQKMLSYRANFNANLKKESKKEIKELLKIGTSAGGARPKAVIAFNERTGEVRSGQTQAPEGFKHFLIKLDGVSDEQFGTTHGYGRVEMAYYHMATDCGIEMMPSRLLEENGRAHFMTQRFDRDHDNNKHHVQSWCALNHFDFNDVTSYSYEQLFQTMRMLGLPYPAADQLFRRMVFNVVAKNCDDHTKNFSFLLKKGRKWELAPAYDICHAYRPDSIWVSQHALSINGKRTNISRKDLLKVADEMNIKQANHIIEQVIGVVSNWTGYSYSQNVNAKMSKAINNSFNLL